MITTNGCRAKRHRQQESLVAKSICGYAALLIVFHQRVFFVLWGIWGRCLAEVENLQTALIIPKRLFDDFTVTGDNDGSREPADVGFQLFLEIFDQK